ncbi:MAG: hypothetical protein ACLTBV_31175 [Enterocloster bolteae]
MKEQMECMELLYDYNATRPRKAPAHRPSGADVWLHWPGLL